MSEETPKKGWFSRLKEGLKKSSDKISDGITSIFTKKKLTRETLDELEELLITSDLGVASASKLTAHLAKTRFNEEVSEEEIKRALAEQMTQELLKIEKPLSLDFTKKPFVILVVGVNGSGKTTTIGKMAKAWSDEGRKTRLVAGDTFRAAAVEQLKVWAQRADVICEEAPEGSDPASLAFDAYTRSREEGDEVLLIDTAGRLQNKKELMEELSKIKRVLQKVDPEAPHACLLVLDATTGQNAHAQVEVFKEVAGVTGLIITKLDGTAKGGVVVSLAEKYGLPVYAVGVGEKAEDLRPFEAKAFAEALIGL